MRARSCLSFVKAWKKSLFSFGLYLPHHWGKIHLSTINYRAFYSAWWEKELFLALVNVLRRAYSFGLFAPLDSALFLICAEWSILSWRLEVLWQTPSSFSLCSSFLLQYSVLYTTLQAPSPKPRKTSELAGFLSFGQAYKLLFRQKLMFLAPIFWFQQKGNLCLIWLRSRSLHFF